MREAGQRVGLVHELRELRRPEELANRRHHRLGLIVRARNVFSNVGASMRTVFGGEAKINSASGDVIIREVQGELSVNSASGDVLAERFNVRDREGVDIEIIGGTGLIEGGRMKLYCVRSFDRESWTRGDLPLEERAIAPTFGAMDISLSLSTTTMSRSSRDEVITVVRNAGLRGRAGSLRGGLLLAAPSPGSPGRRLRRGPARRGHALRRADRLPRRTVYPQFF